MLREDPFDAQMLQQTRAVITSMNRGTSRDSFRRYTSYIFRYRFVLGTEEYRGELRSDRHYEVGHEIDVEYRADVPEINRMKITPEQSASPNSMKGMGSFFMVIYAGLFLVGFIMLCTGRDFLKRQ
jgi:hypothetical protein